MSCAVEGCEAPEACQYRFIDSGATGKEICHKHLGHGLILAVPLCRAHGEKVQRLAGDISRWKES